MTARPMFQPICDVSSFLFEKAADRLTVEDLDWLCRAAEHMPSDARNLVSVMESIGCLVAADNESGSFQSQRDVSTLLFTLAGALQGIAALADVALRADSVRALRVHQAARAAPTE